MMTVGFDQPLYILPFDHRGSFQTKMFGWTGAAHRRSRRREIAAAKQVIYDGFKAAVAAACPRRRPASWWTSSSAPPSSATRRRRLLHRLPRREERPGRIRLRVRRGLRRAHRGVPPDLLQGAGALQPGGRPALNRRQAARLKRLSDYLHDKSASRFMFELLVPPEKAQLERGRRETGRRTTSSSARG